MANAKGIKSHCAMDCEWKIKAMIGRNSIAPNMRRRVPDGEDATIFVSDAMPSVNQRCYSRAGITIRVAAKPSLASGKVHQRTVQIIGGEIRPE